MTHTELTVSASPVLDTWWRRPFRMLQTNLREIDAGMDIERVLDDIEEHGADAWLLSGGGILSFYPTDLPFQTRNPHLADRPSGDLVGDALAATRRRGMRLLARMDFSKIVAHIGRRHPDWLFVDADGENQLYNGLLSVCPSAPYYQERAFEVLTEFATRYQVDGFFFNWMSFNEFDYDYSFRGPCHCASCSAAFAEFSGGLSLPTGIEHASYPTWRTFTSEVLDSLTARFRAHIADLLPEAALVLGEKADIMFHEANSKVGRDFWPHATGQAVSLSVSHRPDVPVLVNAAVFLDMPYRYAAIGDDHYAMYFAQTISRGGIPSTYTMGTPESAPYSNLPAAGAMTRFHRDHPEVYDGLRQSAVTLLVRAGGSRGAAWWEDSGDREFRGCFEALQQAHVPFDMVSAQDVRAALAADIDRRYRVIVLADVGALDENAVAELDDWVRTGGHLISIGSSGVSDGSVQLKTSPALLRVARYATPAKLKNMYVALPTPGVGDGYNRVSPIFGEYGFFTYRPEADHHGVVMAQVPFGPPEKCYGVNETGFPGSASIEEGDGSHTLIPWLLGTTARDLGAPHTPRLLVDAVEARGGRGGITVDLPPAIEVVRTRTAEADIIHLLNFSGLRRNAIGAPLEVSGGSITLPGSVSAARSLVAEMPLEVVAGDGVSTVRLPPIGLFDVIVVPRA